MTYVPDKRFQLEVLTKVIFVRKEKVNQSSLLMAILKAEMKTKYWDYTNSASQNTKLDEFNYFLLN